MALPTPQTVLVSATPVLPVLVVVVFARRRAVRRWKLPMITGTWLVLVANLANTATETRSVPAGIDQTLVNVLIVVASLAGIALSYYGWRLRKTDPDTTVAL